MNRAEIISAWYLRINGFFLIQNFVVHRQDNNSRSTEIDLLALRPPYVFEEAGGQAENWDPALISPEDQQRFVAVICEVRRGNTYDPHSIFRPREVMYAINRFGVIKKTEAFTTVSELIHRARYNVTPSFQIRKLLIGDVLKTTVPPCDFMLFNDAYAFFRARADRYRTEKKEAHTLLDAYAMDEILDSEFL